DTGAQLDARGLARQERQRRDRVVPPRLRRPDVLDPQPLRLGDVARRLLPVLVRHPQPDRDAHLDPPALLRRPDPTETQATASSGASHPSPPAPGLSLPE